MLEIKCHSNIIDIKDHSWTFGKYSLVDIIQASSERSFKHLQRSSLLKIVQRSSRLKVLQRPLEDLRDEGHSRIFDNKDQPRNFGSSFISQIIRGSMQCLRDPKSSKNLRKTIGNKYHSRIFGRSWRWIII